MGLFLNGLGRALGFGASGGEYDSEDQLNQAKQDSVANSQYDALARSKGFKNGDEMVQWLRQQEMAHGGTKASKGSDPSQQIRNGLGDAAMLHPKYLLEYVTKKYGQATGQDNGN